MLDPEEMKQSLYNSQAAAVYRLFLFLRKRNYWYERVNSTVFYKLLAIEFQNLKWKEAKSKMSIPDITVVDKFLADIVTRKHSYEQYCEKYGNTKAN